MKSIMKVLIIMILVCKLVILHAAEPEDTGYPAGLMAECPGMNRTVTISRSTARTLSAIVFRADPDNLFYPVAKERRCKLNQAGAKCAAKLFDFRKKTKVIISGYLDSSYSPFARSFAIEELRHGYNVMVVEIFPVLFRSYPVAARTTKPLGEQLGVFLASLAAQGLKAEDLELIGGSLGAHIAYFACARFTNITGLLPARLTGLDPAGPCFRTLPPSERFNPSGAVRVDALHTNIDGFGLADPVAQVDFYANGGEYQPAMAGNFILPCFQLCSHIRAAFYWINAYRNPDKFLAVRCDSLNHVRHGDCYHDTTLTNTLGPLTDHSVTGIFYLPTLETEPYYMGEEGLKKRSYGSNEYLLKASPDKDIVI